MRLDTVTSNRSTNARVRPSYVLSALVVLPLNLVGAIFFYKELNHVNEDCVM